MNTTPDPNLGPAPEPGPEPTPESSPVQASRRFVVAVLAMLLAAGVVLVMIYARALLLPLAVAVVIWLLLNALAGGLASVKLGRFSLPKWICLLLAVVVVCAIVYGVAQIIASSIAEMSAQSAAIETRLDELLKRYAAAFGLSGEATVQELLSQIDPTKWSNEIAQAITGTISNFITIVIYVAFLLVEQNYFNNKLYLMFPHEARREQVRSVMKQIGFQIRTYLLIKTWLAVLVGVIAYVIMAAVGLKFAGFFAFLAFLGYYIPTIGPIVAIVFPVLFALVQFGGLTEAVIILVVSGGLQILISNTVEPRFMARSLNVSMFVLVFALFTFGAIWGIVGMFLSAPMLVILMIILWNIPPARPVAVALSETGRVVPQPKKPRR